MDRDLTLSATADVYPCRFVKLATTGDYKGTQAGANERTIGISGEWTKYAPGLSSDTGIIAASGDPLPVYGLGRKCLLELGGTVARGGSVKSDSDGKGVAAATTGTTMQEVGAIALESGVSGQKIMVLVERHRHYPALA